MGKEFTKDDLIIIERKINRLKSEKDEFVINKRELEQTMMELKNKVRSKRLNQSQYIDVTFQQEQTRARILQIEKNIISYNKELAELHTQKDEIRNLIPEKTNFIDLLNTIQSMKNQHLNLSRDMERIAIIRRMNLSFADELQKLIEYVKQIEKDLNHE